MSNPAIRINIPSNPKDLLELATKIYQKHMELYDTPQKQDIKLRYNCIIFKPKILCQQQGENSVKNLKRKWY